MDLVSAIPPIRLREASARRAGRRLQVFSHISRAIFETVPERSLENLDVRGCFESGPDEVNKEAIMVCAREFDPKPAVKAVFGI